MGNVYWTAWMLLSTALEADRQRAQANRHGAGAGAAGRAAALRRSPKVKKQVRRLWDLMVQ